MRAPLARGVRVAKSPRGDRARGGSSRGFSFTTDRRGFSRRGLRFGPTANGERTGGQSPPAPPGPRGGGVGQRCVTPRQTCPRPNGLGRNLRSKTRWFTGFCNSHQVSHFATFFIDARAEISVAESRFGLQVKEGAASRRTPSPGPRERALSLDFLGAVRAGGSLFRRRDRDVSHSRQQGGARRRAHSGAHPPSRRR